MDSHKALIWSLVFVVLLLVTLLSAGAAQASVTIETVLVGDVGNAGEWSGEGYGGYGENRICGAVSYEFNIGKYEVTAGQYTAFLNAVAATDTYGVYDSFMWFSSYGCKIQRSGESGSYTYNVAADWANRSVNRVSWGSAARFANWLHNGQPTGAQGPSTTEDGAYYLNGATSNEALGAVSRQADWKWAIPTEDEWYKAAYYDPSKPGGAGYWDYPTGTDSLPGRDMAEATNPGNNANYYSGGYLIGSPYYRTPVGEFELSDSPYGTLDQGGNVCEWTEATQYGSDRGLRGGDFRNSDKFLHACYRSFAYAASQAGEFGFRVVEIPEPASLAFLALGGVGMLIGRRSLGR